MSSLIAYLNHNQFVIATDTFVHSKNVDELDPVNFCSKTIYLPQHKCCVAGQGVAEVLNQFFVFAQQKVIAKDVHSLVNQATIHFSYNLDNISKFDNLATLFVFGVNDLTNKMEVYKMVIQNSKPNQLQQIEFGLLHKPEIVDIENILKLNSNTDIYQKLAILMKEQKKQDDLKKANERAGIGGQIQITTMVYDDT